MKKFATVAAFLDELDVDRRERVEALRAVVLAVDPGLDEHIKWNSPSYVFVGEDRITFSVRPAAPIRLVLHAGATNRENKAGAPRFTDPTGLLEWHSDIRASVVFHDSDEIRARTDDLSEILARWLRPDAR